MRMGRAWSWERPTTAPTPARRASSPRRASTRGWRAGPSSPCGRGCVLLPMMTDGVADDFFPEKTRLAELFGADAVRG